MDSERNKNYKFAQKCAKINLLISKTLMNKKIFAAIVIVAVVALAAFAFSLRQKQTSPKQTEKFNLSVNTWVGFGPYWLAQEKGFFKDEGVDVNISVVDDSAQRKAIMVKGDIDGLGDTVDLLVLERDEKVPAVAVQQIDVSNGADGILATDDIKTVQDLKGKKIAVQKNFVSESFLNYVLKKNGLKTTDVQMIDMEAGSAGAAFVAGQVDVAVSFEPWLSKAKERKGGGHVLVSSADVPGVLVDALSINEKYLKEHPGTVKKVMRAWFRAVEYIKQNPDESNAIMAKYYKISPQEYKEMISGLTWPSLEENKAYLGNETGKGTIFSVAQTFIEVFKETGQIKSAPNMEAAIDQSLINSL